MFARKSSQSSSIANISFVISEGHVDNDDETESRIMLSILFELSIVLILFLVFGLETDFFNVYRDCFGLLDRVFVVGLFLVKKNFFNIFNLVRCFGFVLGGFVPGIIIYIYIFIYLYNIIK
jgi:hypothetical protein